MLKCYTYDGVYMRYFRGGKALKIHFGTSSKLQCPILFMKSMYAMYKTMARTEPQPIKMGASVGIENNMKYTTCSANGWMIAVSHTINCVRRTGNCELTAKYCIATLSVKKNTKVTGHNEH
jgi:hypothetical protein